MEPPAWFAQLPWRQPVSVATLNIDRGIIPESPGCYAFTEGSISLLPRTVLYVGQASTSLRQRLPVYLVDWTRPRGEEGHKGKGFVLEARAARGDNGVYVRWFMFGGNHADLDMLEASLINYLNPLANDRDDDTRHPVLTRRDQLDSRLLG
jgi:hypothetical protein